MKQSPTLSATYACSSVVEHRQVELAKARWVGDHVDLDDLPALDREAECLNSRPRGAMTTPTGRSFWGRAFLLQTLF
jgi:hypothetical protein